MSVAHYCEQFQAHGDSLPGTGLPWLQARRQAAAARFSAGGFPSPREEEWKYTNVTALEKKLFKPSFGLASLSDRPDLTWLDAHRLADAWTLVLVDGRFDRALSSLEGMPETVWAGGMAEAIEQRPERVETLLGAALARESHGFAAFNTAFFTDGAFVEIPAGVVLAKPLQLLHVSTRPEGLATTRSLIDLGRNAEGRLIETFVGAAAESYLTAAVIEVNLGENAGLDFCRLQTESQKAYHFGGIHVTQGPASRFTQHNLAFGGLLARCEIRVQLGAGSECEMNGLFLAKARQHMDNLTLIEHIEPHATSRESYRGVLAERSRGVFQGRIVVYPRAQKTSAEMNNRNLLLSDDAEIDSKPQLEILADDVKCSHGVTIGQLDPESVFYLESRGVDRESARNMLTFAFANAMIEKIALQSLRGHAREQLLTLFPQTGIRRDWL